MNKYKGTFYKDSYGDIYAYYKKRNYENERHVLVEVIAEKCFLTGNYAVVEHPYIVRTENTDWMDRYIIPSHEVNNELNAMIKRKAQSKGE